MARYEFDSMSEGIDSKLDSDNMDDDEIQLLEIAAFGDQDDNCPLLKRKNAKIFASNRQSSLYD